MIKLTHLDGEVFLLNAELIEYVEARPDTFVTLTSGTRFVVREPMDEVLCRAVDYHRSKFLIPPPQPCATY
jgi:flagellar protein FlbD